MAHEEGSPRHFDVLQRRSVSVLWLMHEFKSRPSLIGDHVAYRYCTKDWGKPHFKIAWLTGGLTREGGGQEGSRARTSTARLCATVNWPAVT